ncbi:type II toxin-antitoxin system RelE/ParE family toxin [Crenothrix sp.]|uniref:type II toxin-antitoxin system RelE/ParE family toxin n=1 Tax=Crenothrix sp. TaxID=3100433 RepID=UPI00374DEC37
MRLRWSKRSINDLIAIQRHIAQNNPLMARKWISKIRRRAKSAADMPMAGRVVPEFNQKDIREVFLGSYRIVYRVREDDTLILTVFEGHQLLQL